MPIKFHRSIQASLISTLLAFTSPSFAVTECAQSLGKIWAGDEGHIWLAFESGGSGYLVPSDPDLKNTLALATAALMGGKTIIVRYATDGVSCNAGARSDIVGIWLVK